MTRVTNRLLLLYVQHHADLDWQSVVQEHLVDAFLGSGLVTETTTVAITATNKIVVSV